MRFAAGALLIMIAGLYPFYAMLRLNKQLTMPDGPGTSELAARLMLYLSLPFALALIGTGLIIRQLAVSPVFQAAVISLLFLSATSFILSEWFKRR